MESLERSRGDPREGRNENNLMNRVMLRLVQHRYRTELESTIASLLQFRINGRDGISLNRPLYR